MNPDWVPIEKAWLEPVEVMPRVSPPDDEVENVCTEATRPLSEVSPPPAPASLPQEKSPVVVE